MSAATASISTSAIAHNVGVFRDLIGDSRLCAVVKADGYGHGAVAVANAALDAGAAWLAVATANEAVELAEVAESRMAPVLVLSERPKSELRQCWAELPSTIRFVVASLGGARTIDSLADAPVPVHMKVDTGMHRMGIDPGGVVSLAELIESLPSLVLEGVCTHLAVADEPGNEFTSEQAARFDETLADLDAHGRVVPIVHMANSAATITRPDTHRDMVRLGIAMYGTPPSLALNGVVDLHPALRLSAEVTAVRMVGGSESVSYGRHWFAEDETRVATLPIGYADGIRRNSADARVEVLIRGCRFPIVGAVTMDQTMVAVDDSVEVGDEVVLIGTQGSSSISAEEIAERLGTISYEVLVSLGNRIARRVVE